MTPEERVAVLIARAEKRRKARRRTREQFDWARAHGLVARHAAKLAHLDAREQTHLDPDPPNAA